MSKTDMKKKFNMMNEVVCLDDKKEFWYKYILHWTY
jgi:hypothetical protein